MTAVTPEEIARGLGRWWRRQTRCRFGRHRDAIYTTQTEYSTIPIPGFFAPPRDGAIGYGCWDCNRIVVLGTWKARASNRKVSR